MTVLKLMQIPQLNSVVIKQEQGHFFIATPNSLIIDKAGFLKLVVELYRIGFLQTQDISKLVEELGEINANKENSSNLS